MVNTVNVHFTVFFKTLWAAAKVELGEKATPSATGSTQ